MDIIILTFTILPIIIVATLIIAGLGMIWAIKQRQNKYEQQASEEEKEKNNTSN